MDKKYHVISLTVHNKDKVYKEVSELLHSYAESICLRVGYPIKERNIIFLVMNASTDLIGALTGKLGQLSSVKVKATVIKE